MTTINIIEKDEFTGNLKSFTIDVDEVSYISCDYPIKNNEEEGNDGLPPNTPEEEMPILKIVTKRSEDIHFGTNPTVYKIGDNEGHIITTPSLRLFEKAYMTLYAFMEESKEEGKEGGEEAAVTEEGGKGSIEKEDPEEGTQTD